MTNGTWFVFCSPERAIPVRELAAYMATFPGTTIREDEVAFVANVHDRNGRDADIVVGFSTDPDVAIEAAEIGERHNRPEIAACKARYELVYDLQFSDELSNPLAWATGMLEERCGGIIYDVAADRFV